MSANVESMFSASRLVPWHGLGEIVDDALTSEEALRKAGLDWEVVQIPLFAKTGDPTFIPMGLNIVDGYKLNVRSTDNMTLGVVSDQYQIVQNKEAFSFMDTLLTDDSAQIRYETAGSLSNGKRIWLLAKMPETKILDDAVDPYMVFTTGHDGRTLTRICMTPIRVVCQNTLNLALQGASRQWSAKHTSNIKEKMEEAQETLGLALKYMDALATTAVEMANDVITKAMFNELSETLFPMPDDINAAKPQTIEAVQLKRKQLNDAYFKSDDIERFLGTKWGVINAVSDAVTHNLTSRQTQEALFNKTLDGHPLIDQAYEILAKL